MHLIYRCLLELQKYTYKHSFVGFSTNLRKRSSCKIQKVDLLRSVTIPPLMYAPDIATSLTLGIADVTVTPSEHTGLDGSNALLYATTQA